MFVVPARSLVRLTCVACTCIAGLLLALAPQADAAAAWLPTGNLTPFATSTSSPAVDADANGDVVAGWIRYDGANYIVEIATRTAGGDFTVTPLQTGSGSASNVTVAVNSRGDAIVAWRRNNATSEIWATTRSGLGGFATPQAIASVPGQSVNDPSVAVNDAGAMMVVWWLSGTSQTIYGAYRQPGGSFVTAPISSSDPWNQSPRVVLDPSGRATIVWSYWNGGTGGPADNIARVRVRAPNGTLGTQRDLSAGAPTGFPMFATVGLDRAGNAVAVWSHWNGTSYDVTGATRAAASDTWNSLPVFGQSAGASFGSEPQVAVDPDGDAVAIWRAADNTIAAAHRSAGGSFGAPQTGISQPTASEPHIELDPSGKATAVWLRTDGDGSRVEAATRPLSGSFGAVKTLSGATDASPPALAVDRLGNALALWPYADASHPGDRSRIQYAAYDASGPTIAVDGPSGGTVGQPLGFTAHPFDVWSPVTTTWSFGDGTGASGGSVAHAFGSASAFNVAATATDAVGNTASAARTVQVSNPPPAPSGGGGSAGAPKLAGAKPAAKWKVRGAKLTLTKLTIKKLPRGWAVKATCKGKKCPFKTRKLKNRKVKTGTLDALKAMGNKHTFHAGQTLELRISAKGYSTRVVRYALKKGRTPKAKTLCLAPGARTPTRTCG